MSDSGRGRGVHLAIALLFAFRTAQAATVTGGFEGSNVVDINETAPNNFSCRLATPTLPTPDSMWYNTPGDHHHNWFMLRIEGAAGQAVTVTIENADYGGTGFWGSAKDPVYVEAPDPNALSAETQWKRVTNHNFASPKYTFTLAPVTDLAWVALSWPSLPTHTENWIAAVKAAAPSFVTVETAAATSRGMPVRMLFITDPNYSPAGKKGVVLYGQEHDNEQTGGLTCQGLAEFLVSGDPAAQALLRNVVFIVIPDMSPDATASGTCNDPDDGRGSGWVYNPANIDRLMAGMIVPMTTESMGMFNRIVGFVDGGGRVDFCFNIHTGGVDNWYGVYELADPKSGNLDGFLRSYMPTSGAPWVPNQQQGYTRGGWQNYTPTGPFSFRLLGRLWEEWRTVPMGYEVMVGSTAGNYLTEVRGIKYFGEAIARALYNHYGGFERTVAVTSPDGGGSFASGGQAAVAWTSAGAVSNVRIDVSMNNGASWSNLVSGTANDGSQTVTLPSANSSNCLIRVSDSSALGVSDESDAAFTIGIPPMGTLTVTSPGGGETWYANWMNTVTWTSTGSVPNVKIELSADNGSTWRRLAYSVTNNGSYKVNVPDVVSDQCKVRVTSVENGAVSDMSSGVFSIQPAPPLPALTVISPNGGEMWQAGGAATVSWNSFPGVIGNAVSSVGISLSTDEGASWSTLVASTPNDGTETVNVPVVESDRCLVWVFDARNDPFINKPDADPLDLSDALFSISSNPSCPEGSVCDDGDAAFDAGGDTSYPSDGSVDVGTDGGTMDDGAQDTGTLDAGADAGFEDAATDTGASADSGAPDAGPDAAVRDVGVFDGGPPGDAGVSDGGAPKDAGRPAKDAGGVGPDDEGQAEVTGGCGCATLRIE